MNQALLIIDIQNDYFPGGTMELVGSDAAASNAATLISAFRARNRPVIFAQHFASQPDATFFLPGTEGADIHGSVSPQPGEIVVRKNYPNSFRDTTLLQHLRDLEVDSLVIAGMMTHMCVDTTTRAAADLGFNCVLVHDACATRDLMFGDKKVSAADVQISYIAAIDGAFASVQAADTVAATT
jgi:nicotinamidase-related amidase